MPLANRPRLGADLLLYAAGQFVVLTAIAMAIYPGGAVYERDADHYLFFRNFFSDLGAIHTYSGRSNLGSHVLFAIALASVGLALLLFSSTVGLVVERRDAAARVAAAARWLALVAGLGFVGIAATPWDHLLDAHNAFVRVAFGFLLAYAACLAVVQLANAWPLPPTVANLAYLVLLVAYVVNLFVGPGLDSKGGVEFQVAAQKAIVYVSIANLAAQALAIRAATRPESVSAAAPAAEARGGGGGI